MSTGRSNKIIMDGFTFVVNEIPMTSQRSASEPLELGSETSVIFSDEPTAQQQEDKAMKDELVHKIITILRLEGVDHTDGDCLDLIAELLEEEGYDSYPDGLAETVEDSI